MPSRAHSWSSRPQCGSLTGGRASLLPRVKRWDGAARSSADWDCTRRDPELWLPHSNCFIHLCGKGQARRGATFRLPMGPLLAAKCHPLIQRFIAHDVPEACSPGSMPGHHPLNDLDFWHRLNPTKRVDLFIPPPLGADRREAFLYHLAVRNLFAWVFRKSLVGEYLGSALVALLNLMSEFRSHDADHVADLMDYLEDEGYLNIGNEPTHALAVLRLAEVFQLRDLFINAFAHCAGMSEHLFSTPEYQLISSVSKRLIRRARVEMDLRLSKAGNMLRTFLQDELSESFLGLPPGGRAHLERFRSFIFAFYSTKLGYYPPPSTDARSTIFEPEIYRRMFDDFKALYELLVDERFTPAETTPPLARGSICVMQTVHSFDLRCRYDSLPHPLPLLPDVPSTPPPSRRFAWFSVMTKQDKQRPDSRLLSQAALTRASNHRKHGILQNELVQAYRRFEELSVPLSPGRGDRHEKIDLLDARKARWIFIYSVYQALRSCTRIPAEVRDRNVEYNMAVSTENLAPWMEGEKVRLGSFIQSKTAEPRPSRAPSMPERTWSIQATPTRVIEIKPDIDYFALTHQNTPAERSTTSSNSPSIPERTRSLSRTLSLSLSLSRNNTLRRSLTLLKGRQKQASEPSSPARKTKTTPAYHEIVVHGYGNGTHAVSADPEELGAESPPSGTAESSVSGESYSTAPSNPESVVTTDTPLSSVPASLYQASTGAFSPKLNSSETTKPMSSTRSRRREARSYVGPTRAPPEHLAMTPSSLSSSSSSSFSSSSSRPRSLVPDMEGRVQGMVGGEGSADYVHAYMALVGGGGGGGGGGHHCYKIQSSSRSRTMGCDLTPALEEDEDIRPVWEQFHDLGGLKRPGPAPTTTKS
ncbi:hypothetical protein SODALDRAFT_282676 [Sodiomyces alkalinus F11]|uniref:DUF8004 domain-containing protein n=1 Tax=Sodiomyces alkalinus (strain CBS 110278 / VKM F-3762 / F11) TaxID=1314773 RepID=A0A3N2PNZ8_SODAK|nr:hypothetical protein SODALDRAFT_282676 [Sodiomyces alkalinus F11]ROT36076.1 hypothetical protein SODALDRAFT_282676 [Sodiomyces alkalinus F11]